MKLFAFLPFLASLSLAAQNATQAQASKACQNLFHKLPGIVAFQSAGPDGSNSTLEALYNSTKQRYWDYENTLDSPACMVFPYNAQDVSTAVKVLNAFPDVPFALKSGGHNWNTGFSSTDGGVLISFRPNLQGVALSEDKTTADIGPGARWTEVMTELDKHNRCAVGGRNGDVGVGGYVILGGISYLSSQYGFASDNVVNFETVLANGTIMNANATHNSDLYFALRGGGNNFAIVTKYTLLAHPIGQIWGGQLTYTADKAPQLIAALSNYITNFNESFAKSAIVPNVYWGSAYNNTNTWSMNYFWDGPSRPDHVFDEFLSIPAESGNVTTQSYPSLLALGSGNFTLGRTTDRVNPLANLPPANMTSFMEWHIEQAGNAPFLRNNNSDGIILFSMAIQPIPVDLQKAKGVGSSGALSVDPNGGDKLWIEYSLAWEDGSEDARLKSQLADLTDAAQEEQKCKYAGIKPTKYRSGKLPDVAYNPLFSNDAQAGQDIYRSYGQETYDRLVATSKRYDPGMFFQHRTSGFHLDME